MPDRFLLLLVFVGAFDGVDQIHDQRVVRNGNVIELCLLDNGSVDGVNFGTAAVHDVL